MRRGTRRAELEVADLSVSGCRLKLLEPLPVGERIWVTIPMLEALEATVMWVRGFEAGCAFSKPLHPAVLNVLISAHASR